MLSYVSLITTGCLFGAQIHRNLVESKARWCHFGHTWINRLNKLSNMCVPTILLSHKATGKCTLSQLVHLDAVFRHLG